MGEVAEADNAGAASWLYIYIYIHILIIYIYIYIYMSLLAIYDMTMPQYAASSASKGEAAQSTSRVRVAQGSLGTLPFVKQLLAKLVAALASLGVRGGRGRRALHLLLQRLPTLEQVVLRLRLKQI